MKQDGTAATAQPGPQKELYQKRDEYLDKNRRKKREEIITKKRGLQSQMSIREEWQKREYTLKDFPELLIAINSNDEKQQYFGAIGIRCFLSKSDELLIQKVIDAELIARLISFTERYEDPLLQHEAVWALANVTSGTTRQVQSITSKGGILAFVRLLKHEGPEISEQAIYGLGNIAAENYEMRDQILEAKAIGPLLDILQDSTSRVIIQKGTWALKNMILTKPSPKLELLKEIISVFSKIIQETQDTQTLAEAAFSLSHLCDANEEQDNQVSLILKTNICQHLVGHIKMEQNLTALDSLVRILGHLLSGTEEEASEVLRTPGVVEKLIELAITHKKRKIVKEACWCLSKIASGNQEQIQIIINNEEQINNLMHLSQRSEIDIVREALGIFSNATARASPAQMKLLCDCNIMGLFVKHLGSDDSESIKIALDGVANLLNIGASMALANSSTENHFLTNFEDRDGTKLLENLQTHSNYEIYQKALQILEKHYEGEDI